MVAGRLRAAASLALGLSAAILSLLRRLQEQRSSVCMGAGESSAPGEFQRLRFRSMYSCSGFAFGIRGALFSTSRACEVSTVFFL